MVLFTFNWPLRPKSKCDCVNYVETAILFSPVKCFQMNRSRQAKYQHNQSRSRCDWQQKIIWPPPHNLHNHICIQKLVPLACCDRYNLILHLGPFSFQVIRERWAFCSRPEHAPNVCDSVCVKKSLQCICLKWGATCFDTYTKTAVIRNR